MLRNDVNCHGPGKTRRGAVAVLVAVSMGLLMGVLALSVDTGRLFDCQRRAQSAADAAALAAATELYRQTIDGTGEKEGVDPEVAALEFASRNGFPNSAPHRVDFHNPPISGQFAGRSGFVQVLIESSVKRTFSSVFGRGALTVKATSVAGGTQLPTKASLLVLDPKKKHTLKLKGKTSNLTTAGDIFVNSANKSAVKIDKKSQIEADALMVTGGMDRKSKGNFSGDLSTGAEPSDDPYTALPIPSKGPELQVADYLTVTGGRNYFTLPPGHYKDLKFNNDDVVVFQPGLFYVEGRFEVSKQASATGSGVTLYFSGKKDVRFNTSGTVRISPPTSGTYAGVTMFMDRGSKKKLLFKRDADLNVRGIIYAPNSEVKFQHTDAFLTGDADEPEEDDDSVDDLEDDPGSSPTQGRINASLVARKLVVDKHSHVVLQGSDIDAERMFLGIIE